MCKPDPVFYSNRAACWNVLSEWEKVVEDTSAALVMDSEYLKALNRRAIAYEHLEQYDNALLDFTASCIIDQFTNRQSRESLERLLKKVAEKKAKVIMEAKGKRLPGATFVGNYLQSFRPKTIPAGLDSEDLDEETGKGQLRKGYLAMEQKTGEGYDEAAQAFEKALELGELGEFEGDALNQRATFTYLRGDAQSALEDLNKSIEIQPSLTQSYIKRASLHLELGKFILCVDFMLYANTLQETRTVPWMTLRPLLRTTKTTLISTITAHNFTLSSANLPKPPRITKSQLTSTHHSSTLTSSSV